MKLLVGFDLGELEPEEMRASVDVADRIDTKTVRQACFP